MGEISLCTRVTRGCYGRPREPLPLVVGDLFPPVVGHSKYAVWGVRLHPFERGHASKAGAFDDSVLLDLFPICQLGQALEMLKGSRPPDEKLFNFTPKEWRQMLQAATMHLGLNTRKLSLYELRHSGPSNDLFHRRRSLNEVKRRGRWGFDGSVRRCEKRGRLAEQMSSLSRPLQRRALSSIVVVQSRLCEGW